MTPYQKGQLDFIRQQFVGSKSAILQELEGATPSQDDPEWEEFLSGYEDAQRRWNLF